MPGIYGMRRFSAARKARRYTVTMKRHLNIKKIVKSSHP